MKRVKLKNVEVALERLSRIIRHAKPIGKQQYYALGWIVVKRNKKIKTAFKPETLAQQLRVLEASKKLREESLSACHQQAGQALSPTVL